MQKFSFTVDVVTDAESIDVEAVRERLFGAAKGFGTIVAVHKSVKADSLAEQGYKVWAKRVAGVSLAAPKPVKAPKAEKVEAAVAVEA